MLNNPVVIDKVHLVSKLPLGVVFCECGPKTVILVNAFKRQHSDTFILYSNQSLHEFLTPSWNVTYMYVTMLGKEYGMVQVW